MMTEHYVMPRLTILSVRLESGFAESANWDAGAKGDPSFEDGGSYDV